MLSALLAVIMTIGLIPMGSVTVKAETKNATLSNLGALGTVKIGSKSESGTWYQTEVAGTPVFCLDLGKACHTGDVYVSSDATYSSDSKNEKKALEAKIGYWYSVTKNESTKSWVYAQALMWACEEGETSEKKLTDVISQVRKNTGYYDSKSAAELYAEIFKISATVSCKIKMWKYGGSGSYRQVLLEIVGKPILPVYEKINDTLVYRQRITIDKTDEDGNPVSQVPFEVTAQNYKELYDYKVNGWGDAESGDAESGDADGESVFTSIAETDAKGRITYKFNYQIQSKNYGYVKASDLANMTADDKKSVKDKMDDKNINYSSDLTKSGAEKLMKADLSAQMKKISNQYAVKEVVNTKIIIYAVAFSPKSELLSGLYARGIRNYIFSEMLSDKKKDLTNCINGFYEQWGYESLGICFEGEDEEQTEKLTKKEKVKTIGVAGAVRRMGTTTQALQIVKYLKFNGYKAAYFEMNNHGFVKAVREFYEDSQYDEMEGLTEYQNVDMYYKAERLKEVQDKDYEYIVYDYGVYSEHDFNKVSFLEKDIQIFVVGSKPDEFEKTYELIKSNFYNDVFYVFNFTAETEKKDIKELMEDKADKTFFADESKDPFTFGNSGIYKEMIPIENKSEEKKEKKSGFFRKRKK